MPLVTCLLLAATATLAAPQPAACEEPPTGGEQATPAQALDEEPPAPAPTLVLKAFGDIDFAHRDDGTPSTFALGELDFFVTAQLAPGLGVLAEVVFEPEEGSTPVVELERYVLKYAPRDFLQLAVGRMHTPLGYWNQTFHHGTWFPTTLDRPVVYRWEHDGGVLPVHEVGLHVLGAVGLPGVTVEYNASLTNGRGPEPEDVQDLHDANSSKAVNLWLGLVPRAAPALKLGGVVRYDTIPGADADAAGLQERIVGGFVAFTPRRVELLAELLRVEHEARDSGQTWRTLGGYVQGAVRLGRFKPYYRFDYLDVADGEPYYHASGELEKHALGLRFDPWSWACVTLELAHERPPAGESFRAVALQAAFTF